jgi:hypothetical protein
MTAHIPSSPLVWRSLAHAGVNRSPREPLVPSLMPRVIGYAEPQFNGRSCVSVGAGVAHWCRAGDDRVVVFIAMPGT